MCDFHYNDIKKKHDAKLLFLDTDSLTYEIKMDVFEDIYRDKHLFDLNNHPNNSKFFDPDKKKVIGKMKGKVYRKNK